MKLKSESEVAQSCPTLSDPMDYSLPGSSVHGIFQARVLQRGATAFSVRTGLQSVKPISDRYPKENQSVFQGYVHSAMSVTGFSVAKA